METKLQVETLCKARRRLTASEGEVVGQRFAGLSPAEVGEISGKSGAALREIGRATAEKLHRLIW